MTEAVGFPAFPATQRRPGRFARTWWGQEWLRAMAETAMDTAPLKRGRRLAHAGRVGPITVSPGQLTAQVTDVDAVYHTVVFVDRLSDQQWQRFLDEVTAKAGHLAALLDRDMPHELVEAAADADVPLLPGLGELRGECDCPDWEMCQHAAAVCFQTSWLLDADPFVLLLLRGRAQQALTDELRERTTNRSVPPPSAHDRPPHVFPLVLPDAPGVDPSALTAAGTRAMARARELLRRDETGAESEVTTRLSALLNTEDRPPHVTG
ncbi:SWIM zinc finger family protein [Actinophytocola sediminis]